MALYNVQGVSARHRAGQEAREGDAGLGEVGVVVVQAGCVRVGNVERFCMAKWTMAIYWGTGDSRGSPTCGLHEYISTCMVCIH